MVENVNRLMFISIHRQIFMPIVDAFSTNVPDMRITKADRMQTRGIVQALMYTRASPR